MMTILLLSLLQNYSKHISHAWGLGMSFCYGVVRDHGGDIEVTSQLGEGTTVRIKLPRKFTPTDSAPK